LLQRQTFVKVGWAWSPVGGWLDRVYGAVDRL